MRAAPLIRNKAIAGAALAAVALHVGAAVWMSSGIGPHGQKSAAGISSSPMTIRFVEEVLTAPRPPDDSIRKEPSNVEAELSSTRAPDAPSDVTQEVPSRPISALLSEGSPEGNEEFAPARLPGEPLIKLDEEGSAISGRISLRLDIDETGRVVGIEVVSREGLADAAAMAFIQAFSSYDYIPARRAGRSVRSTTTMVVGVEDLETRPAAPSGALVSP